MEKERKSYRKKKEKNKIRNLRCRKITCNTEEKKRK